MLDKVLAKQSFKDISQISRFVELAFILRKTCVKLFFHTYTLDLVHFYDIITAENVGAGIPLNGLNKKILTTKQILRTPSGHNLSIKKHFFGFVSHF
jgi:hypothetical protein